MNINTVEEFILFPFLQGGFHMKKASHLTVNKIIDENKLTLILDGRLDTNTAPESEKALNESLENVNDLVLDFSGLEYISSVGLRLLLTAKKRISSKGSMKIIGVKGAALDIFEITGLTDIITIE